MSRARLLIFSWHTSLHSSNYLQAQSPAPVPGGRCPVRCFACSCVQVWQVCIEYRPALLWLRQNFPPRETQTETVGRCQSCQASVSSQHICTFRNLTSNSKFRTSRWLGPHILDIFKEINSETKTWCCLKHSQDSDSGPTEISVIRPGGAELCGQHVTHDKLLSFLSCQNLITMQWLESQISSYQPLADSTFLVSWHNIYNFGLNLIRFHVEFYYFYCGGS